MDDLATASMRCRVLKFGGTSVATLDAWHAIARIARAHIDEGVRPVLVCSALAGVSDRLEALIEALRHDATHVDDILRTLWQTHDTLAHHLGVCTTSCLTPVWQTLRRLVDAARRDHTMPAPRAAAIMACGELMSTRLGVRWLNTQGLFTTWWDARDWLHTTPDAAAPDTTQDYLSATCYPARNHVMRARWQASQHDLIVTQGFIARHPSGDTALLGRGGSDTSAAYLAVLLAAERLEIWSDVPGFFSANPRQLNTARLIKALTYDEAESLAAMGGSILHPRCIKPLRDAAIPMRVGATLRPDLPGTWVSSDHAVSSGIKAISSRDNLMLLSLQRPSSWQPVGFMAEVASCFRRQHLSMDLLASSPSDIRVTLDLDAFPSAHERLPTLLEELRVSCVPELVDRVASVSLVGQGMHQDMHRLGGLFELLNGFQVFLVAHAANNLNLSCVIDASVADAVVAHIHDELFATPSDVLGPTWAELHSSSMPPHHPAPVETMTHQPSPPPS